MHAHYSYNFDLSFGSSFYHRLHRLRRLSAAHSLGFVWITAAKAAIGRRIVSA